MSQEDANRQLMLSVTAAWKTGDVAPLLAATNPYVVWRSNAPREFFRCGGTHNGLTGLREYLAQFASRYQLSGFEPKSVNAWDDQVWGLFEISATYIPTGKPVVFDCAIHWTIQKGKITHHQAIFDTASVLMQQGDLTAAA